MKHPITLRIDPDLLASAKGVAKSENRTLTNFIETLLKQRIAAASASEAANHIDASPFEQGALRDEAQKPKKGVN